MNESGRESSSCLLELSWNGDQPLSLEDGTQQTFLKDRDVIELRGWAGEQHEVDFGAASNVGVTGLGA